MKKTFLIAVIIILVIGGLYLLYKNVNESKPKNNNIVEMMLPMKITSTAFLDLGKIPVKYTCDGEGINPPLEISNVPKDAKALALTVVDPEGTEAWVHWLMWNIPSSTTQILENSVPSLSIVGQGSNGQSVYGGLCPPSGTHRYIFTLYALKNKLSIPSYSYIAEFEKAIQGQVIEKAVLNGLYGRN